MNLLFASTLQVVVGVLTTPPRIRIGKLYHKEAGRFHLYTGSKK